MGKSDETLKELFEEPTKKNILYSRVVAMIKKQGGRVREGRGSKVSFIFGEKVFTFHRPHPQKEFQAYNVERLRDYLTDCGVTPSDT